MIPALLDHLWQSTVFAAGIGLLTLSFRRNGAHVRHWLWLIALLKFLVPFSLLVAVGRLLLPVMPPLSAPTFVMNFEPVTQPFVLASPALEATAPASLPLEPMLLAAWALGVFALAGFWLAQWLQLRAAMAGATPLPMLAPVPVLASSARLEPGLVGIVSPVLLLPGGILENLSPAEMQAILAHELCHLERRDNLKAAIQMTVQMLLWFHPLIWWIGTRLIAERERACDEAVLESGNAAETYAESILKVCRFYARSPLTCAAGVSGADLKLRIEAIMEHRLTARLTAAKRALLAAAAVVIIAIPVTLGLAAPLSALAQDATHATPEQIAQTYAEQARPRRAVTIAPRSFDRFVGHYQWSSQLVVTVSRSGGRYFTAFPGQLPVEMFPERPDKFFAADQTVPEQFSFVSDPTGNVTALVQHKFGFEQTMPKIDEQTAQAEIAYLANRKKNKLPSPGIDSAIRNQIMALERGSPDYHAMAPFWAAWTRRQAPYLVQMVRQWGGVQVYVVPKHWSGRLRHLLCRFRTSADRMARRAPDAGSQAELVWIPATALAHQKTFPGNVTLGGLS